jgi:putative transposase
MSASLQLYVVVGERITFPIITLPIRSAIPQRSKHDRSTPLPLPALSSALVLFPAAIRKVIYTTNAIESVNNVIRKLTRNRKQYPNADSAFNLVYMAIRKASRKCTMPIRNWTAALNHFAILFEDRMPKNERKLTAIVVPKNYDTKKLQGPIGR